MCSCSCSHQHLVVCHPVPNFSRGLCSKSHSLHQPDRSPRQHSGSGASGSLRAVLYLPTLPSPTLVPILSCTGITYATKLGVSPADSHCSLATAFPVFCQRAKSLAKCSLGSCSLPPFTEYLLCASLHATPGIQNTLNSPGCDRRQKRGTHGVGSWAL